jgi:hypothetical protein
MVRAFIARFYSGVGWGDDEKVKGIECYGEWRAFGLGMRRANAWGRRKERKVRFRRRRKVWGLGGVVERWVNSFCGF